jgi:hypothetical protein
VAEAKKLEKIEVVVHRDSTDELTYAVVTADVAEAVKGADDLLAAVRRAVTAWFNHKTEESKHAWEYAGNDFNVGDLSSYVEDGDLVACLTAQGVHNLAVETHSYDGTGGQDWVYDTKLVDEEMLEDEEDEDDG